MATTADEGMAWSRRFFGDAAESAFLREEHDGRDSGMWVVDLGWRMVLCNFEKVLKGDPVSGCRAVHSQK